MASSKPAEKATAKVRPWRRLADALAIALLVALAVAVVLSGSSLARGAIGRDSGVFLYAGQRLLAGDIPYVDFWDHKGPVIYYINALGLLIGGGSPVGVLILECISLAAAALVGYLLLRREFGRAPALVASAAWLVGAAPALGDGNFTEEYALPLQFLALYLASGGLAGGARRQGARWLAVGACGGILFLLKPSLVSTVVAVGLALLLIGLGERRARATAFGLSALVVGTATVLLATAAGLAARGALSSAYDQIVVYNAVYSHAASFAVVTVGRSIWPVLVTAFNILPPSLLVVAGVGWFAAVAVAMSRFGDGWLSSPPSGVRIGIDGVGPLPPPTSLARSITSGRGPAVGLNDSRSAAATNYRDVSTGAGSIVAPRSTLSFGLPVLAALLDLPIEVLLVALVGRSYEHFLLAWLPGLAVLAACAAALAVRGAYRAGQPRRRLSAFLAIATTVLLLGVALWPAPRFTHRLPENLANLQRLNELFASSEAVSLINELSAPSDSVLIWGAETALNFQSGRISPTRYTYQYPLFTPGYANDEMAFELLRDLRERRPQLIVDTAETNLSIPPLDGPSRKAWAVERAPISEFQSVLTLAMAEVFAHIQRQYRLERTFGYNWKVYRLTDEVVPSARAVPSVPLDLSLGREIALRGYDLPSARVHPSGKLTLTLYWEPLTAPSRDYTVFVHLVGSHDRPIAQKDGYPLNGRYPTSLWRTGEVIRDTVELVIPPNISGSYRLLIGMYDLKTMERLPVGGAGYSVEIGPIEVGE